MKHARDEIRKLAEKVGHVLVATADGAGLPHLAVAAGLRLGPGRAVVTDWFCPGTVSSLQENRCVTLTIWDARRDEGYQLVGQVVEILDRAVMDGYDPSLDQAAPMPQVQRELVVRVDHVLSFSLKAHSDKEESVESVASG